jgi:serine/threonine-protein kinase RsbW
MEGLTDMYHKIFPAELDHLYEMLSFIRSYHSFENVSPSTLDQIILATEEALVNIINYGYPKEKKGTVEITCEKPSRRDGIKIIIKDQGIPFNPVENIPSNPPATSRIENKNDCLGGYGIFILVGLMDRVEYQRVDGGNILSLTKYLC